MSVKVKLAFGSSFHTTNLNIDVSFEDLIRLVVSVFPITNPKLITPQDDDFQEIKDSKQLSYHLQRVNSRKGTLLMILSEGPQEIEEKDIVPVRYLDHLEFSYYTFGTQEKPVVLIVGGVHGSESTAIEGVRLLKKVFDNAPDYSIVKDILSNIRIVIVPCINKVGQLADTVSSPAPDCKVSFVDQRVIVQDDEKRQLKYPSEWEDGNKGWDPERTLVQMHLNKLISMFQPHTIIMNHDWDTPNAKIRVYGPSKESNVSKIASGVSKLFNKHNPQKANPFGNWKYAEEAKEGNHEGNLGWKLGELFNISSFLVETYSHWENSSYVQLSVTLFLLSKLSDSSSTDDEIISDINQVQIK
eukprot:TRINITY_DN7893_c0_g1_i1.p1 TRINITY_DN7893_c0_g1~~TRINITY_DN7893_c0_g1_i1.p1  ORF type:complete len:357 (-),score=58.26 TRINITY_DN7893_c0_g1_i1:63-1133(-)